MFDPTIINGSWLSLLMNSPWFPVVVVWSLVWKGFALWKSARLSQKYWFIALLIVNLFGILEILYIFVFSKMGKKDFPLKANQ